MTLAEALALPAGPELDRIVAERVMGWRWRRSNVTGRRALYPADGPWPEWMTESASGAEEECRDHWAASLPPYSTDVAAAWMVVERVEPGLSHIGVTAPGWEVVIYRAPDGGEPVEIVESGPTAPLAICRAALAACWGEETTR